MYHLLHTCLVIMDWEFEPVDGPIQAGYTPIQEDVPLVRTVAKVPVEPIPDSKIVVEFAGQWPKAAANLMLSKTKKQHEKHVSPKHDFDVQHRSLAKFEDLEGEPRNLYLRVVCTDQPMPMLFKLAEQLQPVSKKTDMDEWDNVLVPILPVVENNGQQAMLEQGYIYIVWNNKVWRELEVDHRQQFSDIDLRYYRGKDPAATKQTRHVDVDGNTLVTDGYVGGESFELRQNGVKVFTGTLPHNQTSRVFGFTEEEVDVVFPELDLEPMTVATKPSPAKAGAGEERIAQGMPMPHVWVPYKIKGQTQQELYLHYSVKPLTLDQVSDLESDPASHAIKLSELASYSSAHSFSESGEVICALKPTDQKTKGAAQLNSLAKCNIAACKLTGAGRPQIRYLWEPNVDQSDDFFAIRNQDKGWISKAYLRTAPKDEEGYLLLNFASPPPEIDKVQLVRAAHSDLGTGTQHYIVLEDAIPVSELLG
ncbi:hypothetical protein L4C34_09775 [Vibrio profundum]|uniref:hypothetical protein n=1 Tax=Vibrio profundum TaxID=2910247 RepID=UPI003D10868F